ncbi:MAG: metallophosphoesterase [Spirochaetes bacterium]|nr:metallophosphoesterase [Spirochaetota bacterium]
MRIFTVSDIHIDFKENRRWLYGLSRKDYKDDILILAGDITNRTLTFIRALIALKNRFKEVLYVPGNHDLWVSRKTGRDSIDNFNLIKTIARNCGVIMEPLHLDKLSIVPLFGWYDYSFGKPSAQLYDIWMDFSACKWPEGQDEVSITRYFTEMNESFLNVKNEYVISFSHFVPRIDLMPPFIPGDKRIVYPVLGTNLLEEQIRRLMPDIHVYGHSHVNIKRKIDNIVYINNAYGYPSETRISMKKLIKIHEF